MRNPKQAESIAKKSEGIVIDPNRYKNLNVNPSEKSPTFMLRDESHGSTLKTPKAFFPLRESRDIYVEEG